LDLRADGTNATTVASAPAGAAELDVAVPVPAADVDDDVGAAAADDVDDDVLLPQPTMAAVQASASTTDSHVLIERIALLLVGSQNQAAG
jgi:hypothetical protein